MSYGIQTARVDGHPHEPNGNQIPFQENRHASLYRSPRCARQASRFRPETNSGPRPPVFTRCGEPIPEGQVIARIEHPSRKGFVWIHAACAESSNCGGWTVPVPTEFDEIDPRVDKLLATVESLSKQLAELRVVPNIPVGSDRHPRPARVKLWAELGAQDDGSARLVIMRPEEH